jgi:hypothetical protein
LRNIHNFRRAIGLTGQSDTTGSVVTVENLIERFRAIREELEEFWRGRHTKLDMSLRVRLFETDTMEVLSRVEIWFEESGSVDDQLVSSDLFSAISTNLIGVGKMLFEFYFVCRQFYSLG